MTTNDKKTLIIENHKNTENLVEKSAPAWMRGLRKRGISRFQELGVPTIKDEEWKYTNLSSLTQRPFHIPSRHTLQEIQALKDYLDTKEINIVFINGKFSVELSNIKNMPQGLTVVNLNSITAENDPSVKLLTQQYDQPDTFAALNDALLDEGIFIKVEDKTVIKNLIHIVHVTSLEANDNNAILTHRSLIVVDQSAQVDIMESHLSFSNTFGYFTNALTDIFLAENSRLRYCKAQSESLQSFHIGTTRARQKRVSYLESFSMMKGAKVTRNNLSIVLEETGANAILDGLYIMKKDQHVDNHTSVDHRPPNCLSNQLYKGILNDHSRAVFNGKIFVRKIAQQTNSYQLNKNLLLGTDCRVDTKPQLEIFADDVKCTHGATIGQLDEDEIFYLQSRSIPKKLAVQILARGFMDDILNRITNESIHQKLNKLLSDSFESLV